ncbi:hypothetical protein BpHYR1_038228 [Brachionus plicatilis]|uniref:Uncharacterized protein n=1 Tax=Brachionus plicatilis TaxID=10195 RepID=A0A3M7PDJ8_BRAPC|nr:hypothetical protein BpHYR1_038228 [Brachionus plicatilis]
MIKQNLNVYLSHNLKNSIYDHVIMIMNLKLPSNSKFNRKFTNFLRYLIKNFLYLLKFIPNLFPISNDFGINKFLTLRTKFCMKFHNANNFANSICAISQTIVLKIL